MRESPNLTAADVKIWNDCGVAGGTTTSPLGFMAKHAPGAGVAKPRARRHHLAATNASREARESRHGKGRNDTDQTQRHRGFDQ